MSIANDNCSLSSWRGAPLMCYHGLTLAAQHISDCSKCITTVLYSIGLSFCVCLADVLAALCCWIRVGESSLAVVHSYAFLWAFSLGRLHKRFLCDRNCVYSAAYINALGLFEMFCLF